MHEKLKQLNVSDAFQPNLNFGDRICRADVLAEAMELSRGELFLY
jgi:hypothetical protein